MDYLKNFVEISLKTPQNIILGELIFREIFFEYLRNFRTPWLRIFNCISIVKKEISKDEAEKILKESQKQQLDQELKDQRKPEKKAAVKKSADNKSNPKVKKTKTVAKKLKKVSKK